MFVGGEERKNKEENHTRSLRSRSIRFPSLRGEMIGGIVDLDLLSLFPQRYAIIMGGIDRGQAFPRSTMEE